MLHFTSQGRATSLALLVSHDVDQRDTAYTAGAEAAMAKAYEQG